MFFQVVNFLNNTHFKFHISIYHENEQYELTYVGGTWTKIKPILIANVNDNNKNSLSLSGNLTVEGAINGTASSAARLRNNGLIDESVDWNTLIETGIYQIINTAFLDNSSNYPNNIYKYGLLYVTKGNYSDVIQQVYIPHHTINYNAVLATRMQYGRTQGFREWNYCYNNDYTSISLTKTGYIVFRNRLTIQWGEILKGAETVNIPLSLTLTKNIAGCACFDFATSSSSTTQLAYVHGADTTNISIINNTYGTSNYKAVHWIYFGYI